MVHIAYSPYFYKQIHFSTPISIFAKYINFLLFAYNLGFLCLIYVFASPYFDRDGFTHHALHVLDAPSSKHQRQVKRGKQTSVSGQMKQANISVRSNKAIRVMQS